MVQIRTFHHRYISTADHIVHVKPASVPEVVVDFLLHKIPAGSRFTAGEPDRHERMQVIEKITPCILIVVDFIPTL